MNPDLKKYSFADLKAISDICKKWKVRALRAKQDEIAEQYHELQMYITIEIKNRLVNELNLYTLL